MTISRIIISEVNDYDENRIENLLTEYGIAPEDMISVVHDKGSVYLYFYTWN